MSSLKPREWHRHKNRKIAICLHWLRARHHYLNSFAQRINQENDPSCRLGCQAIENSQHVLLACPVNEHYHLEFRLFLAGKNLEANLDNLLGLNTSVSTQTQIRIRDLLAKFLAKTSLTDWIKKTKKKKHPQQRTTKNRIPNQRNVSLLTPAKRSSNQTKNTINDTEITKTKTCYNKGDKG